MLAVRRTLSSVISLILVGWLRVRLVGADSPSGLADALQECKSSLEAGHFQSAASACQRAWLEWQNAGEELAKDAKIQTEIMLLLGRSHEMTQSPWKAIAIHKEAFGLSNSPELRRQTGVRLAELYCKYGSFEEARDLLKELSEEERVKVEKLVKEAEDSASKARQLISESKWPEAEIVSQELATRLTPYWKEAHELRLRSIIKQKAYQRAIDAAKSKARTEQESSETDYLLGRLYMAMGNAPLGKKFLTECARLNPDHQKCLSLRSKIKQIESATEDAAQLLLREAVDKLTTLLGQLSQIPPSESYYDPDLPNIFDSYRLPILKLLCTKESKLKLIKEANEHCSQARELDPANQEFYLLREAELAMAQSKFDDAVGILRRAQQANPRSEDVRSLLQKADQLRLEKLRTKYYDTLGVSRDASADQIKKAYSNLVRLYHPDKQATEEARKESEERIYEINTAYSVLSDKEKRAQYDAGMDPNDPHGGAAGAGGFYRQSGGAGGTVFFNMGDFEDLFRGFHHQQQRQQRGARHTRRQHYYHEDL